MPIFISASPLITCLARKNVLAVSIRAYFIYDNNSCQCIHYNTLMIYCQANSKHSIADAKSFGLVKALFTLEGSDALLPTGKWLNSSLYC